MPNWYLTKEREGVAAMYLALSVYFLLSSNDIMLYVCATCLFVYVSSHVCMFAWDEVPTHSLLNS